MMHDVTLDITIFKDWPKLIYKGIATEMFVVN